MLGRSRWRQAWGLLRPLGRWVEQHGKTPHYEKSLSRMLRRSNRGGERLRRMRAAHDRGAATFWGSAHSPPWKRPRPSENRLYRGPRPTTLEAKRRRACRPPRISKTTRPTIDPLLRQPRLRTPSRTRRDGCNNPLRPLPLACEGFRVAASRHLLARLPLTGPVAFGLQVSRQ